MAVEIHFLNVGHGDCTFVDFPSGNLTMIDVNNSKSLPDQDEIALAQDKGITVESFRGVGLTLAKGYQTWESYYKSLLVDPYDYFQDHFKDRSIFRYIQSHPDMDHMSGLFRFFWQEDIELLNFWKPSHQKSFDKSEFDGSRYDWNDWLTFLVLSDGVRSGDQKHKALTKLQGNEGDYWTSDGLTVLGPTTELADYCNKQENWNNASYVLRLSYAGRRVVLAGDAEQPEWDSIESLYDAADLKCDLLKAAHHGRNSGYSQSAVAAMDPEIVVCSVGKKPDTDASSKYNSQGAQVLSTRFCGSIRARIESNGELELFNHKDELVASLPALI